LRRPAFGCAAASGFILKKSVIIMKRYYQRSKKTFDRFMFKKAALGALMLFCLSHMQGCSFMDKPDAEGWYGSADALAQAVAQAVSTQNEEVFNRMRISRDEYMDLIWPNLEYSRLQGWKDNPDFIWRQHAAKSDSGLREMLRRYGGNPLRVLSVKFPSAAQEYGNVKIHSRPELLFDNSTKPGPAPVLMGSMIEKAGRFKVFSYNIRH